MYSEQQEEPRSLEVSDFLSFQVLFLKLTHYPILDYHFYFLTLPQTRKSRPLLKFVDVSSRLFSWDCCLLWNPRSFCLQSRPQEEFSCVNQMLFCSDTSLSGSSAAKSFPLCCCISVARQTWVEILCCLGHLHVSSITICIYKQEQPLDACFGREYFLLS